jgi:hypothetical protein
MQKGSMPGGTLIVVLAAAAAVAGAQDIAAAADIPAHPEVRASIERHACSRLEATHCTQARLAGRFGGDGGSSRPQRGSSVLPCTSRLSCSTG